VPNAPDLASEGGIGEHHAQYIGKFAVAIRVYCFEAVPAVQHLCFSICGVPLVLSLNKEDQVFTRPVGKF